MRHNNAIQSHQTKRQKPQVNYRSASTPATLQKQESILRWLRAADEGFSVVEIAQLLGISRQLALYHLKKLAAAAQVIMVLEPCERNGGLQYRIWDHMQLVTNFVPTVPKHYHRIAA